MKAHQQAERRFARTVVCIVLAAVLLALPIESRDLPDPLAELGSNAAAAQVTPVQLVTGTPSACDDSPDYWSPRAGDPDYDTAEDCELELPACPENPLQPNARQFMLLSAPRPDVVTYFATNSPGRIISYAGGVTLPNYSHFCELRVRNTDPLYGACTSATGVVLETFEDPPGDFHCRLLHPIACPAGLQLVSTQICRGIQRRTWSCTPPDTPLNEFNSCAHGAATVGSSDACNPAPSSLTLVSCDNYVKNDFVANPTGVVCASAYLTDTPVNDERGNRAIASAPAVALSAVSPTTLGMPANDYWCTYNVNWLRLECHGASPRPPDCAQNVEALCLKRASEGGGCDGIASTIRCRAYEAAYREHRSTWVFSPTTTVPADYVRLQGCEPCTALPFERIPTECPAESKWEATPGSPLASIVYRDGQWFRQIRAEDAETITAHQNKTGTIECADPPSGWITWSPTHTSGRAVVNSAAIVTINGLDLRQEFGPNPRDDISRSSRYPFHKSSVIGSEWPIDWKTSLSYTRFDGNVDHEWYISTWNVSDVTTAHADLDSAVGNEGCVSRNSPSFRLIARELWPDNGPAYVDGDPNCVLPPGAMPSGDALTIHQLFGPESLRWWCALDEEQRRRRTSARGLQWWHDPGTDQNRRNQALTVELPCSTGIPTQADQFSDVIWCRWIPVRSGYFRLHAASVWDMRSVIQMEPAASHLNLLLDYLNDPNLATAQSRQTEMNNQLRSANLLSGTPPNTDWSLVGLDWDRVNDTVSSLPVPGNNPSDPNWVYREEVMPVSMCPTVDLRVYCLSSRPALDYSETPPIGVIVHETRVVTRAPS